jgi:predicted dehydrogenase
MKLKAAIIGLGRIGVTLEDDPLRIKPCTHIGAMKSVPEIEVIAGCDIDPDRRDFFRKRWKIKSLYSDFWDMLKNEKIDLLTVATWTDSHSEIVRSAARIRGIKAIVCEKPIAFDSRTGSAMVSECRRAGKILVINHERRFEDRYRAVKKLIDEGQIGTIRTIVGNVLTAVPQEQESFKIDQTSLLHDGTHLVDIIGYLAGPVRSVTGFLNQKKRECITAVLQTGGGATAFIETGGLRNYFNFELDIQGTHGRIMIGNTHFRIFKSVKSSHYSGFRDLRETRIPAYKKTDYFTEEYRESVRKILHPQSASIASTGEDGLTALRIIEAIFASIKKNNRTVTIK